MDPKANVQVLPFDAFDAVAGGSIIAELTRFGAEKGLKAMGSLWRRLYRAGHGGSALRPGRTILDALHRESLG